MQFGSAYVITPSIDPSSSRPTTIGMDSIVIVSISDQFTLHPECRLERRLQPGMAALQGVG
jgi:hypothetical protein